MFGRGKLGHIWLTEMILTNHEIHSAVLSGDIVIKPFRADQLNPNSYDFRLGCRYRTYTEGILDPSSDNLTQSFEIPKHGVELSPSRIYLVDTEEAIGSAKYVPIIRGRSSIGRLGIFINITADMIDIGTFGAITLQLHCVEPVRIYPDMVIGQVTFWKISSEIST